MPFEDLPEETPDKVLALDAAPLVALGRARLLHPGNLAVGEADNRPFGFEVSVLVAVGHIAPCVLRAQIKGYRRVI